MSLVFIFVQLLLIRAAAACVPSPVQAGCGSNVTLPCACSTGRTVASTTWYKFLNQDRRGIIRLSGGVMRRYLMFLRTAGVDMGEDRALFLSSVTPADSGTYECATVAGIGEKGTAPSTVKLSVSGCVSQAYMPSITPTSTTGLDVEDKTRTGWHDKVVWSIIVLVVCLVKIALSLMTAWVVRAAHTMSSGRRRQRWKKSTS